MDRDQRLDEAFYHVRSGNYELGISVLKELELVDPLNHEMNYLLGFSYRQINQFNLSESYLRKSIETEPNIATSYIALGVTQQKQMKYDEAVISFKSAIKINSDSLDAYNSLGYTHRLEGKLDEALQVYSTARSIMFDIIYENVTKSNRLISYLTVEKLLGDHQWMTDFLQFVMIKASKEGITKIALPTGETALKIELETTYDNNLFFDKGKTRSILPNFIHNFAFELNSNIQYSLLLNNVAAIYAIQDRRDIARKFFIESILFTPENQDYQAPIVGLQNLDD